MILSQTARYALRALVYLAEQGGDAPIRVDQVAEGLGVPRNYLSKILHTLARNGLLNSLRGPNGGFHLARGADEIPLAEVVGHFDTIDSTKVCLLGRPECGGENPCSAHDAWGEVKDRVFEFLANTTIHDLSDQSAGAGDDDRETYEQALIER